jgi:hypothetical protein
VGSDERQGAGDADAVDAFGALAPDELLAVADALEGRVRGGTATLEDYGALARARRALARRAEAGRWARSGGTRDPV